MNKKNFNYLYSLLILNNINAGCKNTSGKNLEEKNTKGSTPTGTGSTTTGKETEKPEEKPKGKQEEETEEQKKQRLEEERLTNKANEIKYFFEVLNKIYLNNKIKVENENNNIKASIDENGIKETIKYFENLNFNDTIDPNYVTNVFTNLYNIFNIENVDKKNEINKNYNENIFHKYLSNLFHINKDYMLLIIKNKNNNEIHFLLQNVYEKIGEHIEYSNKNYDILEITFNTPLIKSIKKSEDEKKKYTDVEMYLAIDLSKNRFVNFKESLTISKMILNHIDDSNIALPVNTCYSYPLSLLKGKGEKTDDYYFIYTNNYIYTCSKDKPNIDDLYEFEHVVKIETSDNHKFNISEEIGKKQTNLSYGYKDAPFSFETYEKILTALKTLKDINKITEVQNELLNLVKQDKTYKGQKIKIENYCCENYIKCTKFEDSNEKDTTFPYKYNIYIYTDKNDVKVDIKKWEDSVENNDLIKLINNFEKNLENLFGKQNYNFSNIVSLINYIKKSLSNSNSLKQIINLWFSRILSNEEWDKLDISNLCIKIADNLSSIELGKNIVKADNFKVFSLIKQEKVSGLVVTKFRAVEKV